MIAGDEFNEKTGSSLTNINIDDNLTEAGETMTNPRKKNQESPKKILIFLSIFTSNG